MAESRKTDPCAQGWEGMRGWDSVEGGGGRHWGWEAVWGGFRGREEVEGGISGWKELEPEIEGLEGGNNVQRRKILASLF